MGKVWQHVAMYPDGISRTSVYRDVPGRRETKVLAVNALVSEGFLTDDGTQLHTRKQWEPTALGSHSVPAENEGNGSASFPGSQAVPDPFPNPDSPSVPVVPPSYKEGNGNGESRGTLTPGQDGYLDHLYAAFEADHVTEGEWLELSRIHQLLTEKHDAPEH